MTPSAQPTTARETQKRLLERKDEPPTTQQSIVKNGCNDFSHDVLSLKYILSDHNLIVQTN